MSSRRKVDDSTGDTIYQFDHGCQSIHPPLTNEFRDELNRWKERGWVKQWQGKFGIIRCVREEGSESEGNVIFEETKEETYVGYPYMSAICEHLVANKSMEGSTLEIIAKTKACAVHVPSKEGANIISSDAITSIWQIEKDDGKNLGNFDWLVLTDRNTARPNNPDLRHANLNPFPKWVNEKVSSDPICTTMITLDKPLSLPDLMIFDNRIASNLMEDKLGMLWRITRDTSKPGRRSGNKERWVLHSTTRGAKRLLGRRDLKGASLDKIRNTIKEKMVEDFENAIPFLMFMTRNSNEDQKEKEMPKVAEAHGHRWGAGFPSHVQNGDKVNMFLEMDCYFDEEKQFLACGDYFGQYHGSVEGAFLSGKAAADKLIQIVNNDLAH